MRITTSSSIINRLGVQSSGCNTPSGLSIMGLLCYMRIMMSNPTKEVNGKTYLQCKQCLEYKELGNELWYKHNEWYLWVLWRCKDCIKSGRKTDKELRMARVRDKHRYYNKQERRDYCINKDKMPKRRLLYVRWQSIMKRCYNKNDNCYKNYWSMWITVSESWKDFENFYNDMYEWFIRHLEKYWRKNTTIDRIDWTKGYCKENCRRATYLIQANNTKSNRIIKWQTLANLCRDRNVDYWLVHWRLNRWRSIDDAINKPLNRNSPKCT